MDLLKKIVNEKEDRNENASVDNPPAESFIIYR